ncbi:hypothetical protein ACGC1H_000331 [Rhizoctonia solani]
MDYDPEYTVMRRKQFLFHKSEIEFDWSNLFTACFLGDFAEARSRTVKLSRNPDLFHIVVNYSCRYTVLPLRDNFAPAFKTSAPVLASLQSDAVFAHGSGRHG